ncbi:hypothetical protein [uncultured Dokdonia sp.]|uniref:hypothetical protein n=1 Tax=uncultured Dokdonia sp. TaxID=575653 RepID=UPI002615EEFF|nr:hypothetical protein [uncultured Dokdonia sp.]
MSASQPASNADQEMDLTDVFALFQRIFYKCLALCFKAIDFIFKFWWIILLLIIAGATLGYFTKGEPKYESSIIIQTNFDSQSYVYNAIKQFDDNLSEKDAEFITATGLDIENPTIMGLEISPVIDVMGLVGELKVSDRNFTAILKELDVDEDTELFASNRFYSNYKYHTLTVSLSNENAKKDINKIIAYINNQPYIAKIKSGMINNMKDRIDKNEKIIEQSDLLISSYAKSADVSSEIASDELSFFNNQNNLNLNGVLAFKNTIITETEELKNNFITASEAVVVASDIQTAKVSSLKDKKEILYPIFFVFIFLFLAGIRFTYTSLRKEVEAQNLLD